MKRLKLFGVVILICSTALFGFCIVRQFQNDDKVPPVIKMKDSSVEVSVNDGKKTLLNGVTAEDKKDGDVSDTLIVDNISDFLDDGSRFVTIAAFDKDNNVAKAVRQITYRDYRKPRYDFKEPMRFQEGDSDYLDNVKVTDDMDGDLSGMVNFSDNTQITADKAGEYKAQLQVRNSLGDTEYLPFTLEVLDSEDYSREPVIYLKHYVKYLKKGEKPDYKANMKAVSIGGRKYKLTNGKNMDDGVIGRDKIKVNDDDVNYKEPGVYEAQYSLTLDKESGTANQETVRGITRLVVVVEE